MKNYLNKKNLRKTLEIKFFKEIENKKIDQLDGSLLPNNGFNKFWLEKMKWETCHSLNGDPSWYDVISLIRYCNNIGARKIISIPTEYVNSKENKKNDFRIFNASLRGFSQALWGIHDAKNNNPFYDSLHQASLETFVMFPDTDLLEFCFIRELGVGVSLAGPREFLEYITSRSKVEWYINSSSNGFSELQKFIPRKDRKTAIREEKMKC